MQQQITVYARAQRLIFSEGSAVHTLQLLGHLGANIAILVRRPWRWHAYASVRPRAHSLTYLRAVESLISGLGPSRRTERHRGIAGLSEERLLRAFRRIGLDLTPYWNSAQYRNCRDRDIRAWIAQRKSRFSPYDEQEHINLQLLSQGIDVRY